MSAHTLKKNSLKTMNNIQDRESRLEEMINSLKREKWNKKDASEALDSGQKKQLDRKEQIENELKNPDISDEAFEALQDEYEQLKEYLPDDDISKKRYGKTFTRDKGTWKGTAHVKKN